jgi:hypothetical protein
VKLVYKTFIFFSFIGLLPNLEAKSLEFFLDHKTQETFNIPAIVPDQTLEQQDVEQCCYGLQIENTGDHPIINCFPYVNKPPCISLEDLAYQLSNEEYPLLALYHLWNQSIVVDDLADETNCHPLDLLNFKGTCSTETFSHHFIKLCNSLGIETRLANVHGKSLYDFSLDDEWSFLDLSKQQIYLGLDNEKLISSEEIMDDPFLALRTKHGCKTKQMDFKESWKQLARFEILEPASAMPIVIPSVDLKDRAQGFDLYPRESLVFGTAAVHSELSKYERSIEHTLDLESREPPLLWNYSSPFPIQKLTNNSSVKLQLIDQKIELLPGESWITNDLEIFQINLSFSAQPKGQLLLSGICGKTLLPSLSKGLNQISLRAKENPSIVRFRFEFNEPSEDRSVPAVQILNTQDTFDYCSPNFLLERTSDDVEMIWWQISPTNNFQLIPSNFNQIESFTPSISLPLISETFLNPGNTYYFRVKGYYKGQWSEWSSSYAFEVNKPLAIEEVEFTQIDDDTYELNWERFTEDSNETIEYFLFGSNALDFIPSIYCNTQVNSIVDDEVTEEECNDNLIAITKEPKFKVRGGLAYYRIVARQHGQFSVPSPMIHVYDQELVQPRNILQIVEGDSPDQILAAKRTLFPPSYPWTETSLPHITAPLKGNNLINIQMLLRSASELEKNKYPYESPKVDEEIWEEVRPYLLPSNHPAWSKLNRVFCKSRATLNPNTFKKAGFKRYRPGRFSRVSASSHPELKEYFIKAYCDCELAIIYDWKKWIHRIKGAETIRACIKKYKLQSDFKVPHKWIYPLPKNPSPPKNAHYVRKNFILVCENMRIQDHSKNEKMYKKKMTQKLMKELYIVLQVCGLCDSVYCFNIPFCKDGRIAVIDTEYHHKWPVPFQKLNKNFSKDLRSYWEKITHNGGSIPNGVNQFNPPRMDRRDVPKQNVQKK